MAIRLPGACPLPRLARWSKGLAASLLFAGDGEHWAALAADPNADSGIYLATPYVIEGDTAQGREFAKKYQERFHQTPGVDALLAYDGVRILFEALRRAKPVSAAKVRAELANSSTDNFDSLTGPLVFNKDHSARRPVFVVHLENGRVQSSKRYEPDVK